MALRVAKHAIQLSRSDSTSFLAPTATLRSCKFPGKWPYRNVVLFWYYWWMPPKVRQLIKELHAAGFEQTRSRCSHRRFTHKNGYSLTLSGKPGADAHHYQVSEVMSAILEVMNEEK